MAVMALVSTMVDTEDARIEVLRDGEPGADGRAVLLWVQRAQRASGNLAANLAVEIADALKLPVVAVFCLVPAYPRATLRAYHFMAEGLRELPEAFAARGIGWELRVGEPEDVVPALAAELGAAVAVTDQAPTRPGREWKRGVADRLAVPLLAVDADVIVPTALFPKEEWAPRTIRPKLWRMAEEHLTPTPDPNPHRRSDHRTGPNPLDAIAKFAIDRSVSPTERFHGGQKAARTRLRGFLTDHLKTYETDRNRADIDGSSGMSPFLHYGQISPIEVACAARDARATGAAKESVDSFMNEIMVQRELTINFALRNPDFDRYEGLPEWGRKSLAKHAGDPRPVLYDRGTMERGETGDPLWNAAQRQMVAEGYMPNRLRMYWAKQALLWTATPEEAYDVVMTMNDRHFVCGRDASGYAQVAWAIGGRHDRPFPPERPILGLIRPMGAKGMRKYFDTDGYIRQIEERHGRGTG